MAGTKQPISMAENGRSLATRSSVTHVEANDDMVPLHPFKSENVDTDSDYTSDDYCEFPSSSDRKRSTPRARAKKARKAAHKSQDSKPLLRPAKDILSRIRHDPDLKESDFIVGYNDRHAPEIMELDVSAWKGGADVTDEEWIPQHRIVYFRLKGKGNEKGERVWDREKRLDRLFGSGVVPEEEEEEENCGINGGKGAADVVLDARDEQNVAEKGTDKAEGDADMEEGTCR